MIRKIIQKTKGATRFVIFSVMAFLCCLYFKLVSKDEPTAPIKTAFEKDKVNEKCEKSKEDARMRLDDLPADEIAEAYGSVQDEIDEGRRRFQDGADDIRKGKYRLKYE